MKEKKAFVGSSEKPKKRFTISKKGVEHGCCYRCTVRDSSVVYEEQSYLFDNHPEYARVVEAYDKSSAARLCHALNAAYGQSKRQVIDVN